MPNITFNIGSEVANSAVFGLSQAPIRALIENRAEAYEQNSMLEKIFNKQNSKHPVEKYTSMGTMNGPMPVGEGGAYPVDGMEEGFSKTLSPMVWRDKFIITREAMDDSKIIDLKQKPTQFTKGFYRVKEDFGGAMLGGAVGNTSITYRGRKFDTTGADGKAFFAKDHPAAHKKGLVQSNLFAGEPTAANLGKLETRMQNFAGDGGEVLAVAPKTILIPNDAELKNQVLEAIGSDKDPKSGNNGFNYQVGRWNLIVWPYLNFLLKAGIKPWFLIDPDYNEEYNCAVLQQRVKMEITSGFDEGKINNVWHGYERYGIGFNDWRGFAVGGIDGGEAL